MWLQIVGKVRMALAPPLNHWWHTTLYVTARGLTTSPIPYQGRDFQVDFDFIDHRLDVTESTGRSFTMELEPMSVATFYREFMARLRELGIDVRIWPRPVEVADAIPFDADETHATYDPRHAQAVWRGLREADSPEGVPDRLRRQGESRAPLLGRFRACRLVDSIVTSAANPSRRGIDP